MITKTLSDKIKIASFICTIMVIFRHSRNLQAFGISDESYCTYIEGIFSKMTELAVPYFFLVSGFFFFSQSYYRPASYKSMISKKIRTLLIPYLIWNLIGFAVFAVAGQTDFEDWWYAYIIKILGSAWDGPLWYVRDLMTMMLLIPLYGWIMDWGKWWLHAVSLIVLFHLWVPVSCNWVSYESMLFFFLGGVLRRWPAIVNYKIQKMTLGVLTVLWAIRCIIFPFTWFMNKYTILLGIIVFWQLLDYLPEKIRDRCLSFAPFSFFIYVAHIFIVKIIKQGINYVFHGNDFAALVTYLACPFLTAVLLYYWGKKWEKLSPTTYHTVTGYR